ncbi:MAG: hypothetical protein KY434_11040, partial [Actinobacteria bacterium]|nr:hypothetical protein [Actinomycetota bacterium]
MTTSDLLREALHGAYDLDVPERSRQRVLAAIRSLEDGPPVPQPRPTAPQRSGLGLAWRRRVAALGAAFCMVAPVGAAAAATDTLPGDLRYPVRRAVEWVWVAATWGQPEDLARTVVAERRLAEAQALEDRGGDPAVVASLRAEAARLLGSAQPDAEPERPSDGVPAGPAAGDPATPAEPSDVPDARPPAPAGADPEPPGLHAGDAADYEGGSGSAPGGADDAGARPPAAATVQPAAPGEPGQGGSGSAANGP